MTSADPAAGTKPPRPPAPRGWFGAPQVLAATLVIYFGNDLMFAQLSSAEAYIVANLLICLAVLVLVLLPGARAVWQPWRERGRCSLAQTLILSIGAIVACLLLDRVLALLPETGLPDPKLFSYPDFGQSPIAWLDASLGLVLVAISEEWVFRGFMPAVLAGLLPGPWPDVVATLAFGAMHWGTGLHNTLGALAYGLVLIGLRRATGTIWPPMAVHYLVNLLAFYV